MLLTIIFSFFHNVFSAIKNKFYVLSKFKFMSANAVSFNQSATMLFGKELRRNESSIQAVYCKLIFDSVLILITQVNRYIKLLEYTVVILFFFQAQEEFKASCDLLNVQKLLTTFIEAKSTGNEKPGKKIRPLLSQLVASDFLHSYGQF